MEEIASPASRQFIIERLTNDLYYKTYLTWRKLGLVLGGVGSPLLINQTQRVSPDFFRSIQDVV